jgi:hypothetical protein
LFYNNGTWSDSDDGGGLSFLVGIFFGRNFVSEYVEVLLLMFKNLFVFVTLALGPVS